MLVYQKIRGRNADKTAHHVVDETDVQLLIKNDQSVRRIVDDVVGQRLRLFHQKRETHVDIRIAFQDGDSLVVTGIISAAAAVQTVGFVLLSHFFEHFVYLFFRRLTMNDRRTVISCRDIFWICHAVFKIFCTSIFVYQHAVHGQGIVSISGYRTADTAALAG